MILPLIVLAYLLLVWFVSERVRNQFEKCDGGLDAARGES